MRFSLNSIRKEIEILLAGKDIHRMREPALLTGKDHRVFDLLHVSEEFYSCQHYSMKSKEFIKLM